MKNLINLADEVFGFFVGFVLFVLGMLGGGVLLLLVWGLETIFFIGVGVAFVFTKVKMKIKGGI